MQDRLKFRAYHKEFKRVFEVVKIDFSLQWPTTENGCVVLAEDEPGQKANTPTQTSTRLSLCNAPD